MTRDVQYAFRSLVRDPAFARVVDPIVALRRDWRDSNHE
jgi:hypothetical protein